MNYIEELNNYTPQSAQEAADKELILEYIKTFPKTILTRENRFAHMTASSMIFNRKRDKVLMVYHNIYRSWSWTGGHADGDQDMLFVARKEATEETGVKNLLVLGGEGKKSPLAAVDVLPVWGHVKRGEYVSSHLHLNFSFLFEAGEEEALCIREGENSDVAWISISELLKKHNDAAEIAPSEASVHRAEVTEPDMIPVYEKLIRLGQRFIS